MINYTPKINDGFEQLFKNYEFKESDKLRIFLYLKECKTLDQMYQIKDLEDKKKRILHYKSMAT